MFWILIDRLKEYDFEIEIEIVGYVIGFIVIYDLGFDGLVIGFLVEYDVLLGLGYVCGYNIIGIVSVFGVIGLK